MTQDDVQTLNKIRMLCEETVRNVKGGEEIWFCVTAGYQGAGHGRGSDMQ